MLRLSSAGNTPANIAGMMAKYFATSLAIENVVSEPRVMSSCLPISTISISFVGFESRSTMFPASLAACVPVFMATPTSAWASAGASFVPSPGHRDEPAARLLALDQRHLVLGRRLGEEVVDARLLRDRLRGERVVARDHDGADAHRPQLGRSARCMPSLTMSLRWMTPSAVAPFSATTSGVPPQEAIAVDDRRRAPTGTAPPCSSTQRRTASAAPLRMLAAVEVDAAHARLRGERDELGARQLAARASPYRSLASTTIERPSGVSSARLESWAASASSSLVDARRREELGRLPVAERDRAGLVEQQRGAVAGRLDRAAAHGEHVALHEAVHAGDADGREQRADRRRDQADEEGDEHDHRLLGAPSRSANGCSVTVASRKMIVRPASRMLSAISFGVFWRLGALDERDHPVEERLARLRR